MKRILSLLLSGIFLTATIANPGAIHAANATLSLSPASGSYANNSTFDIQTILSTGTGQTTVTDVILLFDKNKLTLTDIVPGSLYDQYIGETINNDIGRASISGIANSSDTLYTGTGTFATFKFRTIGTGTAAVTFAYTQGSPNDTNVYEINVSSDSLTSVQNGSYTITTSGSDPTSTPGSSGTTSTTTTSRTTGQNQTTTSNSSLPVSGSPLPALIIAFVGGFFLALATYFGKSA